MSSLRSIPDKTALVYQPNSYVRRGPSETCVQLTSSYLESGLEAELMLIRARSTLPAHLEVTEATPFFLRHVPWKYVRRYGLDRLNARFLARLHELDPSQTIVDVWPSWPIPSFIPEAKRLGFKVVRNMINSTCMLAKEILDRAYRDQGLTPAHGITDAMAEEEAAELHQYDYVISPSAEVDRSLALIGIPAKQIIQSSFGWNVGRFAGTAPASKPSGRLRFLFVGSVGIRKGVPTLLEAWKRVALPNAELLIVGDVEEAYRELFRQTQSDTVSHIPFSQDLGGYYKSADVFVFPSLEEGAPQVIYEAAGCGAAIITTPMGQARMIEPDQNGIVVAPDDADALAAAIRRMATDPVLLAKLKAAAFESAQTFEYGRVGKRRADQLRSILDGVQPSEFELSSVNV